MNRETFIKNVRSFLDSSEFKNRKVEFDGKQFLDKKTGILYGIKVESLKEIDDFSQPSTPMIFVSSSKEVLDKISEVFSFDNWTEEKFNSISGEELDYAYLRQCSILNRKKDLPFFLSKKKKNKK